MRILNLIALTLAVVLFVSWAAIVFYPSVLDYMVGNPSWNGLRDFDSKYAAQSVSSLAGVKQNAARGSLLVTISYRPYATEDVKALKSFVEQGGTLLVMDDYGYGNQVLEGLGLTMKFDGDPLLDPYMCYRNQWFPLVTNLSLGPEYAASTQLVLDHATALDITGGDYQVLAESSGTSFIDRNGNATFDKGEPKGPFPVAVEALVGNGKVVAVSDPSILINSMMGLDNNALFIGQIVSLAGEHPQVLIDTSHLIKSPLDQLKYAWQVVRNRMSAPYAQVLLIGGILTVIWLPFNGKGGNIEQ